MSNHLPVAGGGEYAAVSGTSSVIDTGGKAGAFQVVTSAKAFIGDPGLVGSTATPVTLTAANATTIATGQLYVFNLLQGAARYIHVAGNGGAATITVTLTS